MLTPFDPSDDTHRRYNPLTASWVLCSPHRTKRPWLGAQEKPTLPDLPEYDPKCYLCPGNTRATGDVMPKYTTTYNFENDYAALKPNEVGEAPQDHPLLQQKTARGKCYVVCFNPAHNLSLAELTTAPHTAEKDIMPIVRTWKSLYTSISEENPFVQYIQMFENKGSAMGASNPHPHGQIWSLDYIPVEPLNELQNMRKFALDESNYDTTNNPPRDHKGRPSMLLTYANYELNLPDRPRVILFNEHFVLVVPFWALWPFETMILPYKRQIQSFEDMTEEEMLAFADILGQTTCRLDNIFDTSFPYSMGIHQRPVPVGRGNAETEELGDFALFHLKFYPPLLRSATVRKFLVGFELMAEPQRDLTAEQAAERIRNTPESHYKTRI